MTNIDGRCYTREPAPVLAWPTLERLAHAGRLAQVKALQYWRDLTQHGGSLLGTVGEDETSTEEGIEIRPTEPALLEAIGWRVIGKERWHHTGKKVRTYELSDTTPTVVPEKAPVAAHIKFGDLRFHGNELVEWGRTAKGKPLKPLERPASTESKLAPKRTDANVWRYLRLHAATPLPGDAVGLERVPVTAEGAGGNGTYYDPLPGVEAARAELAIAIKNTIDTKGALPPTIMCPPCLVSGKQWTAGITHCRNDAPGAETGAWNAKSNAARELARMAEESRLRASLGETAGILDLAITDATAKDIGIARGYTDSSAEKYGASVIDRAFDVLINVTELQHKPVADNDNNKISDKLAA
ncbi:hypothetical protein [Mesorhizobium mediterraneum]|uniref:hypothetical protein n=1 Tax=Mesorhizobium mediterraneum TaxID=43617 RepID=UPI00177F36C3|nr:hypothetical protein [Mesorhizobium mediterraneum]